MTSALQKSSVLPFLPGRRRAERETQAHADAEFILHRAAELAAARRRLDPEITPPDDTLKNLLPPEFCLEHRVVPWSRMGDATLIGTAHTDNPVQLREMLENWIGPVILANMAEADVHAQIAAWHSGHLVKRAETQVEPDLSCRDINKLTWKRGILASLFFGICVALIALYPRQFFVGITWAAIGNLVACQIFKITVFLAGYRKPPSRPVDVPMAERPVVSIMIPMFQEAAIAPDLVKRLSRLTYPKSLLDILLVVEEKDDKTRKALYQQSLPGWMRVVDVPDGDLKTKPRALNYALNFARGDIIGILDSEDAPAIDQIERVVETFHTAPPDVACVQGILDFYNTKSNWLSRCFTIEYATWFRIILAGAARLGFAIPLGGTTVYLRRHALIEVGGWDAHNVTEDADLGIRLARYRYRTLLLPTVTREEANNRLFAWIRQRSRWLKGYMITYLVHMRRPFRLIRHMGLWKFMGFQFFFLTTILQFTLAPALWCFLLVFFGLSTPFTDSLPEGWIGGLLALFLLTELVSLLIGFIAVGRTQHQRLLHWVPTMLLYFPLGVFAAYKALSELIFKPFYWDKTQHGLSAPDVEGGDIHVTRR